MAERKSFLLRLPPELWDEIKRWADSELRSVNGQVEFILREAVRRWRREKETSPPSEPPPQA
ncbi:MAG: Arc family DNA-binding protein [Phycisphaerae bacterium]|jgi:hypothetical protein